MMQDQLNHEKLLEDWQKKYPGQDFIKDGIIDIKRWNSAPCKTLFILKESYHPEGVSGPWDMQKDLREYGKPFGQTFWKASYLAYLLFQIASGSVPKYPKSESDKQKVFDPFLSSAIINIKKPVGTKTSYEPDLKNYAREDEDFLRSQIRLIDPQYIVCGGTWELLKDVIFSSCSLVSDRVWRYENQLIFDFWHPGAPAPGEMMFAALSWIVFRSRKFKCMA